MFRIATEDYTEKNDLIDRLAHMYNYIPWKVRIIDIQRAAVLLANPPQQMLPEDLKARYHFATLVMQANGFTFTVSDAGREGTSGQHVDTPYTAVSSGTGEAPQLEFTYNGIPLTDFQSLRLVDVMGKPSVYYFPFKEASNGLPMTTYLIVNPYENCAYRCKYCSRLPYFGSTDHEYEHNIEKTVEEIVGMLESPEDVRFINIITGSLSTAEADIELYHKVIRCFDQAGFGHCEFGVYTSNVHSRKQMELLACMGVTFFTATIEATSDEARSRLHAVNNPKSKLSFDEVVEVVTAAESIFPYVNTTMMLGYEPAYEMKRNLARLANETKATVNHYIPRIWRESQYKLLHPTARNLEYYVDLCTFIERNINAGKKTIGAFFQERYSIPQYQLRYRS